MKTDHATTHPSQTRRTDREPHVVGGFDDGIKRYYDENIEHTVVKLISGDCYVSAQPREMLVTILGSCISVCARDPISGVGGMNHFLLPGNVDDGDKVGFCTRFGAFAMEKLINGIISLGGNKSRLEIKVFGGGNVINNSAMIGSKNVEFVQRYLENEKLKITSEQVGGDRPRRIHYFPDTGKVMMRLLKRREDLAVVEEEKKYQKSLTKAQKLDDIELFD